MADLLRFPFRGTRDVLAGYRVDRGAALPVLEDMVFPDAPVAALYQGARGPAVVSLGSRSAAQTYLGPRTLFGL